MEEENDLNLYIDDLLQLEVKYEEKNKALLLLWSFLSSFKPFMIILMFLRKLFN